MKHLAKELHLRIKEGEASFEEIALKRIRKVVSAEQRGLIGPVPLSQPHPILAKLLRVSTPGQLWPPKQLEKWWIVVRLEELHCAELTDSLKQRNCSLKLGDQHLEEQLMAAQNQRLCPRFFLWLPNSQQPRAEWLANTPLGSAKKMLKPAET